MRTESPEKSFDRWEEAREEARERLQACQKQTGVTSCLKCEKVIGCELRNEYVKKVYESMSKGEGGGFEF